MIPKPEIPDGEITVDGVRLMPTYIEKADKTWAEVYRILIGGFELTIDSVGESYMDIRVEDYAKAFNEGFTKAHVILSNARSYNNVFAGINFLFNSWCTDCWIQDSTLISKEGAGVFERFEKCKLVSVEIENSRLPEGSKITASNIKFTEVTGGYNKTKILGSTIRDCKFITGKFIDFENTHLFSCEINCTSGMTVHHTKIAGVNLQIKRCRIMSVWDLTEIKLPNLTLHFYKAGKNSYRLTSNTHFRMDVGFENPNFSKQLLGMLEWTKQPLPKETELYVHQCISSRLNIIKLMTEAVEKKERAMEYLRLSAVC